MMYNHPYIERLKSHQLVSYIGQVNCVTSNHIESDGPMASIGDYCEIINSKEETFVLQVIAVDRQKIIMVPLEQTNGIQPGDTVYKSAKFQGISVGDAFAGRAINGMGTPIDNKDAYISGVKYNKDNCSLATLDRTTVKKRVNTGIRAIDAIHPIGQGQRIGIFAASGVGKTTMVEQLADQVDCDHCVICLVGERGREVQKMWERHMEDKNSKKYTLVAATSDESAILRVNAVFQALAQCEYWRDKGKHVVLIIDSITRLALAMREIGLAAGEPPTVRAFTPNVFTRIPDIVERCGADKNGGSITAIMTVLSETDDVDDPIVELMKSLLDGHIILSRQLAERGHFPAIDVSRSISRIADQLMNDHEANIARKAHKNLAIFEEARPMIESGIYRSGSSLKVDEAILLHPKITEFLCQKNTYKSPLEDSLEKLSSALDEGKIS